MEDSKFITGLIEEGRSVLLVSKDFEIGRNLLIESIEKCNDRQVTLSTNDTTTDISKIEENNKKLIESGKNSDKTMLIAVDNVTEELIPTIKKLIVNGIQVVAYLNSEDASEEDIEEFYSYVNDDSVEKVFDDIFHLNEA